MILLLVLLLLPRLLVLVLPLLLPLLLALLLSSCAVAVSTPVIFSWQLELQGRRGTSRGTEARGTAAFSQHANQLVIAADPER
jgi:hypothetical protein